MSSLEEIVQQFNEKKEAVQQRLGERRGLENRLKSLEDEVSDLKLDALTTEKAVWLLQKYSSEAQKEVTEKIESIVSSGLQAVF